MSSPGPHTCHPEAFRAIWLAPVLALRLAKNSTRDSCVHTLVDSIRSPRQIEPSKSLSMASSASEGICRSRAVLVEFDFVGAGDDQPFHSQIDR